MTKYLLRTITLFILFSSSAHADFKLDGELQITPPRGAEEKVNLSIGYQSNEYDHKFSIGSASYDVSGRPEKYSFAIVLQKNNYVWIQEFSQQLIKTFEWNISGRKIKLYKKVLSNPVMGDYILSVDDKDYFFSKRIAQMTFIFDEEGIKEIEIDGMVASLGLNKAKTECAEGESCD